MQWISCLSVFLIGAVLTGYVCKLAWRFGFVDEPGDRRSHMTVTPRGGGLSVVLVFWSWMVTSIILSNLSQNIWLPLLPSLIIALMGFWDDVAPLSASFRLIVQFFCAAISIKLMGGIQIEFAAFGYVVPSLMMHTIALIFLVWCINLYNFMDGVNGLAGVEAVSICLFMSVLTSIEHAYQWSSMWAILACSVAGFLWWNFPKAKIFLGDVGSHFLGFMFGLLLIESAMIKPRWFWCGMILLGYFVVDATMTLLVRMWYRQPIFQAHHTHAFQIFWRTFNKSHTAVTLSVLGINVFWLMPWAIVVTLGWIPGFAGMLLAYLPLVIMTLFVKAGRPLE
jgi:Fuc2NAc and GlcNAc transferase